jgi:hypothetical protein
MNRHGRIRGDFINANFDGLFDRQKIDEAILEGTGIVVDD